MIGITTYVTGAQIAEDMSDDLEEAAQFFPAFAKKLGSRDIEDIEDYLNDQSLDIVDKISLKVLGELLVKVGESK